MKGRINIKNIIVYYLFNSGFAVKTKNHFLIFDYYSPTGDFKNGLINLDLIKDENVIVFASHSHADHFNPKIFEWQNSIKNISYVLSNDIKTNENTAPNIITVAPCKEYKFDTMNIQTLRSTDEGVAFLIEIDDITIYHAGDLNWWHWNGETEKYNTTMGKVYKHEIDKLKNKHIDISFVPLDPRLEDKYIFGMEYYLKVVKSDVTFPMHFGTNYNVFKWLEKTPLNDKIIKISSQGQMFEI